jgi:methylated-DNA-[protein]-cysteine S-methyltransferase
MSARHTVIDTSLGDITLVAAAGHVTGLYFPGHWPKPARHLFGAYVAAPEDPLLGEFGVQLGQFLAGERTGFDLPIAAEGDEFQQRVWALLRKIPYGQTTTYGAMAAELGDRSQAQAVGQAVGRNPLCVVIPCHRVVGSNGALTGYAGGLRRKRFLLSLEEPARVVAGGLF